jgi:hypothetical protein
MKTGKIPKGQSKIFARGGKTPMFGKSDRTKSAYPAEPQKPGRTGQHATKAAPDPRIKSGDRPGRAPVDTAGDMGGSPGASQPRRPAA